MRRGNRVGKGTEMAGKKNPSQILHLYQWVLSARSRETTGSWVELPQTVPLYCSLLLLTSYQLVVTLLAAWPALWLAPGWALPAPLALPAPGMAATSRSSFLPLPRHQEPPSSQKCSDGGISVRSTREHVGAFPNATCHDHYDLSQEPLPRMRDQIYDTGDGNGDLYNAFEGPWRRLAPVRSISLTQGSHHVLELAGALGVDWFNLRSCEGISSSRHSFSS